MVADSQHATTGLQSLEGPPVGDLGTSSQNGGCSTESYVDLSEYPAMMRVTDVARVLSISRTIAYEQVAMFERTGGCEGLPVVRIGRVMRVPKAALVSWVNEQLGCFARPADAV